MAYPKGAPRPPGSGRAKGTSNHLTTDFKLAVTRLVESADLGELLADVPKERRLEALARIAEYAFPKQRAVELAGKDGEPLKVSFTINLGDKVDGT